MLYLTLVGCCGHWSCQSERTSSSPVVEAITPSLASATSPVSVEINGRGFDIRVSTDAGSGETTVDDRFVVVFRHESAGTEHALTSVERQDGETLSAVVPAGIPVGRYHVTVEGPYGRSEVLENAYRVCDDPDGDGLCSGTQNCGDLCDTCTDVDGDGWGQGADTSGCAHVGDDCDDTNDRVNPGAAEIPDDAIDQDCTGTDAVTCFVDADQDGYGTGTTVVAEDGACDTSEQEASVATDCDDSSAAFHPGAAETPGNLVDENCDGAIVCYEDGDQDGYGVDVSVVDDGDHLCLASSNESLNTGDCDDTCALCWTGQTEICGDGADNDCSGVADESCPCNYGGDPDGECATATINASTGACAAPSTWEATELTCDDLDNDCSGAPDEGCDDDDDGYCDDAMVMGSLGATTCANTPGGGSGNDCDDLCAVCWTGQAEICGDGEDNDCDGATDFSDSECVVQFTHGGWADVVALGPKRDANGLYVLGTGATSTELDDSDRRVTIAWNAFGGSGAGTEDGYQVFRATTSGGQDFGAPLATIDDPAQRSFTDTTVTPATEYFYAVRPTIGVSAFALSESYAEIRVVAPPDNMALVHRWIANQEVCGLMPAANSSTIDADNNYRCLFSGQGNSGGFFDLGHDLLVDRFELGCDVSEATVGYNPGDSQCNESGDGPEDASAAQLATMASSAALLPPLVEIPQAEAEVACNGQMVTISRDAGDFTSGKQLLSQKEWRAAAAWSPTLTDAEIADIEDGATIAGTGDCNSNNAHGGSYSGHVDRIGIGSDGFRSGSTEATASCLSRYGIQDMVANMYEWASDQCDFAASVCTATGGIDPTNLDMDGFTNTLATGLPMSAAAFFSPALGIPLGGAEDGALTPADFGIARFHDDEWFFNNGLSALLIGGRWDRRGARGRWSQAWSRQPTFRDQDIGARCAVRYP